MKLNKLAFCGLIVLTMLVPGSLFAQTLTFKIASLAPADSDYGRSLAKINAEWIRISGGKVKMQIVAGGAAGNEDEVVRKIQQGSFQGGLFTSVGLGRISPTVMAMSTPLLMKSDAQMKYVLDKIKPELDKSFRDKGYAPIAIARAGWVYIFTKQSFQTPADFRTRKVAVSDTDKGLFAAFQAMGYRPVSVGLNDYISALSQGMIDSFMLSPPTVTSWFKKAGITAMLDLPVAPFLGGILIDQRAWAKVPADLQPQLVAAATKVVLEDFEPAISKLERTAISTMKTNGLTVNPLDAAQKTVWDNEFAQGAKTMLDTGAIDRTAYDKIKALLASFKE